MTFLYILLITLMSLSPCANAAFSVSGKAGFEGYAQTVDYQAAKSGSLITIDVEQDLQDEISKIRDNRYYLGVSANNLEVALRKVKNRTVNSTAKPTLLKVKDDQLVPGVAIGRQWEKWRGQVSVYQFDTLHYQALPVLDSGASYRYKADISTMAWMFDVAYDFLEIEWFKPALNSFWPYAGAGLGFAYKTVDAIADTGLTGERKVAELDMATHFVLGIKGQLTSSWTVDLGYRHFDLSGTKLPRVDESATGARLKADNLTAKGPFLTVEYWF